MLPVYDLTSSNLGSLRGNLAPGIKKVLTPSLRSKLLNSTRVRISSSLLSVLHKARRVALTRLNCFHSVARVELTGFDSHKLQSASPVVPTTGRTSSHKVSHVLPADVVR